jgi:hypothetical protein
MSKSIETDTWKFQKRDLLLVMLCLMIVRSNIDLVRGCDNLGSITSQVTRLDK